MSEPAIKRYEQARKNGLQALERKHSVVLKNPKLATFSANVDDAFREPFPNSPRWDYCLELKGHPLRCVWIEFHPADKEGTTRRDEMLAKKTLG